MVEMDLDLGRLEERYTVDRRELGKILVIASTALLVLSLHSALSFQSALGEVEKVNRDFDKAQGIIESPGFNDSLEALQSARGGGAQITNQFVTASNAFLEAREALERSEKAEDELEGTYNQYRWLVLIAVLGEVAGIAVIYI